MRTRKETLGDVLARERANSGKSIAETIENTHLSEQFVRDLEGSRYKILPHTVYTLHGVLEYARALGLDEEETKDRYIKERGEIVHTPSLRRPRQRLSPVVTTSIIFKSIIALIAIAVVGYIIYQVAMAAGKPPLDVVFPRENQVVSTNEIELAGRTRPNSTVTIDDHQITVAEDGSFRYTLALPEGRHSVTVKAKSDLGRTSKITRHFIIKEEPD